MELALLVMLLCEKFLLKARFIKSTLKCKVKHCFTENKKNMIYFKKRQNSLVCDANLNKYVMQTSYKRMYNDLDPLLHSHVRLAIMSILIGVKRAEFSFLLENINTTKGNLSFQLNKLADAEYIVISKSFRGKYPLTTCQISEKGVSA